MSVWLNTDIIHYKGYNTWREKHEKTQQFEKSTVTGRKSSSK